MEVLKGDKLRQMMDKFITLSSPNICNLVASFKHQPRNKRYVSNIFILKAKNGYYFNHDNCFPGQQNGKKKFLLKMSMRGNSSDYDLIKRMQPRGDLQTAWIMFDHVKRVGGWTTFACHVYDFFYYKVMTIVVCDMQFEDMEVQCVM